jgi:hypothetical protein
MRAGGAIATWLCRSLVQVPNELTRTQKVNRGYALVLAGSGCSIAAVVLLFVSGFGLFLLFAVMATLCFVGFRRTVS